MPASIPCHSLSQRAARCRRLSRRAFLGSALASGALLTSLCSAWGNSEDPSQRDLLGIPVAGIAVASAVGVAPSALNAWARAGMQGMNSAAYLTLQSSGDEDTLIGALSDVADATEVHRSFMDGTVMRMEPAGPLVVPAGGSLVLAPGGYHIMLIGLKSDLMAGSEITLTLQFEQADQMTLTLPVRPMGGM